MEKMEPHQQRVVDEKSELSGKVNEEQPKPETEAPRESTQKKYVKKDEAGAVSYPEDEETEEILKSIGFEFVGFEDKPKPE